MQLGWRGRVGIRGVLGSCFIARATLSSSFPLVCHLQAWLQQPSVSLPRQVSQQQTAMFPFAVNLAERHWWAGTGSWVPGFVLRLPWHVTWQSKSSWILQLFPCVLLGGRSLETLLLPRKSCLSGRMLSWDFDQCLKQNYKSFHSTSLVRPLRHWNVTVHPTCCGWRKGWFGCRQGTQRWAQAEALRGAEDSLGALGLNKTGKGLFFTRGNAASSSLGRKTRNKYPVFPKCE